MDAEKPKRKMGRPPVYVYTPELAEEICEAVATSDIGLEHVLRQHEGWPSEYVVYQWLQKHEDFAKLYARARERQGLRQGDKAVEEALLADDPALGRLRYDARRWHAGKLAPRVYGDTAQLRLMNAAGDGDARIEVAQLADELGALLNITPKAVEPPAEGDEPKRIGK